MGAGYGIGTYMFRALYAAVGLALAGALILKLKVPGAKGKPFSWCFIASVHRLLPVLNLRKDLVDLFDAPSVTNFNLGTRHSSLCSPCWDGS